MKGTIAVVGMGQGAMTAAYKLAQAGYSVDIYEQAKEHFVSYDWTDDIATEVFDITKMPFPDESVWAQKPSWLFVAPDNKGEVICPARLPRKDISVYRHKFNDYFVDLCRSAGAKCFFETKIEKLIVENDRVVGIETPEGVKKYDLVIDGTGMYSQLRKQVPAKFGIQAEPKKTDTLFAYRGFFKRKEGSKTRREGYDCTLTFKQLGGEGISWCNVSPENTVDVLICRMQNLKDEDITLMLNDFKEKFEILGDEKLYDKRVPICLRAGIATPVADGFVCIGDSAFMTIPIMGSGIEAGMKGGAIFAEHIISNKVEDFTAASMWGFYHTYMKKLGAGFVLLDIVRRWGLRQDEKHVNWLLGKFLTDHNVAYLVTEKGNPLKGHLNIFSVLAKPILLLTKPKLLFSIFGMVNYALPSLIKANSIPKKYSQKNIDKWVMKYNNISDKYELKWEKKLAKKNK